MLSQVKAVGNWTNPQHSGLLPWPSDMLYQLWFQKPKQDDAFRMGMERSFNVCLTTDSLETIKVESAKHKRVMDKCKAGTAQQFKDMIDEATKRNDMESAWFFGIAKRVGADPASKPVSEIVSIFNAYYEFEKCKLQRALANPRYNPLSRKNRNEVIDAEQLVYLGDPKLCMLTSDRGFKSKVAQSTQAPRIITVPPDDLMDAQKAEHVVRCSLSA